MLYVLLTPPTAKERSGLHTHVKDRLSFSQDIIASDRNVGTSRSFILTMSKLGLGYRQIDWL